MNKTQYLLIGLDIWSDNFSNVKIQTVQYATQIKTKHWTSGFSFIRSYCEIHIWSIGLTIDSSELCKGILFSEVKQNMYLGKCFKVI